MGSGNAASVWSSVREKRKKKLLLAFGEKKKCLAFEMCIVILCQGFIPTRVLTDVRPRDVLKSDVMAPGSSEPLSAAGRGQGRVQTCPEIVTTQREECPGIYLCFPSFFSQVSHTGVSCSFSTFEYFFFFSLFTYNDSLKQREALCDLVQIFSKVKWSSFTKSRTINPISWRRHFLGAID